MNIIVNFIEIQRHRSYIYTISSHFLGSPIYILSKANDVKGYLFTLEIAWLREISSVSNYYFFYYRFIEVML